MRPNEEAAVSDLVSRVFAEFVAPGFSPEGIQTFHDYIKPDSLAKRSQDNHFVLVAESSDVIVGMIEIRDYEHVSLFYVKKDQHGKGIGKNLMRRALDTCRLYKPDLAAISVNASPYAAPIYEKLGFHRKGAEQMKDGIRFVPMQLTLS
jgi:predicted GNAT family N-acyltransferase